MKFLDFTPSRGKPIRRFQYTAVDDAMRIRALKNAIGKFPLRINTVRTDNGHAFQAKFHWHVEDLGIRHADQAQNTPP